MVRVLLLLSFAGTPVPAWAVVRGCGVSLVAEWLQAGAHVKKEQAFGFHGTSVESVIHAAKTGRFPIGVSEGGQESDDPYWYFYPNVRSAAWRGLVDAGTVRMQPGTLRRGWDDAKGDDLLQAWKGAESYARTIAANHRFLSTLGLPLTEPNSRWAFSVIYPIGSEPTRGFTEAQLARACRAAQRAHGVVLLIAESAASRFPVSNALNRDDGVRFEVPGGLPVEEILAIEPMNDEAWDLLEAAGAGG